GKKSASAAGLRTGALRPRHDRRWPGTQSAGFGSRPPGDCAYADGKRRQHRQSRHSIFCHHLGVGGRQGACIAATGNGTACSRRIAPAELRRPKTAALLGPAPRRSALRENRRLPCAEREPPMNANERESEGERADFLAPGERTEDSRVGKYSIRGSK